MTTKNEDIILERINQLEGKIDRIEQLIMLILDDDNLTEEELLRVTQADKLVKEKAFDKLVLVK